MVHDAPNVAAMTAEEFTRLGKLVVGSGWGWMRRIAPKLDLNHTTVSRYAAGKLPVPLRTAVGLEALLKRPIAAPPKPKRKRK